MSEQRPKALVGGVVAGLVSGMFGVGGGVLLVPFLVIGLAQPQKVAHATSLVAVSMAAATGAARFAIDNAVAVRGGLALAVGALTGARIGAQLLPRISNRWLRGLFALAMTIVALRFALDTGGDVAAATDLTIPELTAGMLLLHVLGGLVAGVTSSMLGVGGGIVMVPLLTVGFGYGQHIAEGTSLAVIVPTAITGAALHARSGLTDVRLGATLGTGAVIGALIGASVALTLDASILTRLFGVLMAVVALLMLRPGSRDT